ncbi:MAG: penicillin-binding transpeptidase domain-containing protein [Acidimicrobiales bacterium]
MPRKRWIGVGLGAAAVLALVAVGLVAIVRREPPGPGPEVARYLQAWERFDVDAMAAVVDQPDGLAGTVGAMKEQLEITGARVTAGAIERDGDTARVPYTAEIDLARAGTWTYGGQVDLLRHDGRWRVQWSPAALHPDLSLERQFDVTTAWPERAPIVGADGSALVASVDVTQVGLKPEGIENQGEVEAALQTLLGVSPSTVRAALAQPWSRLHPDWFVPIVDVRPDQLAPLRPQLEPIPGVFFQKSRGRIGPTADFAAHVLGTVGEVTAERLGELGAPYRVGDVVGLSGIEAANERRLAGTPSGEVQLHDAEGRVVQVLHRFAGTPPQPVRLTLDRAVQQAAEQAVDGVTQPAALVAVDAGTGEIRAIVSRPLDVEFDRALVGQYPPGSTFKIVTTAALLAGGLRPDETVDCPSQVTAGGRVFVNFESGALGGVPFSRAFANSCNTAFASLSARLSGAALAQTAAGFGFGSSYSIGLPVAGGQFPVPADATELTAAALGQGRVQASPLAMASVAAAVSSGQWRTPRLMADAPPGEVKALDPSVAATLRTLMTAVVREGTGTAAARPGQEIAGKTGTAEFGAASPPATHAWFVGFRGSLAFAVLVEGGGVGGRVAAPLAARFLDAAPR